MNQRLLIVATALFWTTGANAESKQHKLSDAEVRRILIDESRAAYDGSCPCPYDSDRAGRRCGKRSAHSRQGGDAPLCYDSDVTQDMVAQYRQRS